jgi:exopolyphosphatase/guanosine-5'-triphosphate,3'-diphosphate pyrophosphatase
VSADLIGLTTARRHRLAGVDVGTNTIRMLVADVDNLHQVTPLAQGREMARLGEGMGRTGRLSDAAMARGLKCLEGFAETLAAQAPEATRAVATSAVREAGNGPEFVRQVRERTGIDVQVIDGEEEARLSALGAAGSLVGPADDLLVLDIGGGSTEFVLKRGGVLVARVSVPIGVVMLTERFLASDPPKPHELYDLDEHLRDRMREVRARLGDVGNVRLVATAGTPTTLAAIDMEMAVYDPARVNNHPMTLARVEELFDKLASVPLAERAGITGIERGREDLIVSGCAVLYRVMHDWQFGGVTVSDWGLREGLVLDLFDRLGT